MAGYQPRLLTIPGMTEEVVATLECTNLRRSGAAAFAVPSMSYFRLSACFRPGCCDKPILSGHQLESRIMTGVPIECPSHKVHRGKVGAGGRARQGGAGRMWAADKLPPFCNLRCPPSAELQQRGERQADYRAGEKSSPRLFSAPACCTPADRQ